MKKILILLTTLALLLSTTLTVFAADDVYYGRYGEAGNSEAQKTVSELANEIYDNYEIDAFYFVTDKMLADYNEAAQFSESIISQYSQAHDTVAFVRGPEAGYLVTKGYCDEIFTQEVVTGITKLTSPFELRNEYDNAASAYFAAVYQAVATHYGAGTEVPEDALERQPLTGEVQGETTEPTTISETTPALISPAPSDTKTIGATAKKSSPVKGVIISLIIGLIVAAIVIASIKSSYKPVRKNRAAANYLVNGSVHITNQYDNFVRKETTQRERNTNQNQK